MTIWYNVKKDKRRYDFQKCFERDCQNKEQDKKDDDTARKKAEQAKKTKNDNVATILEVVGMDIGYGNGTAIGGSKYALILVDQCTTQSFVYGMHGSSGADVCEALWKFFIDAGGFPHSLQYDFDLRLIGGKAAALLHSHGTCLSAAPPGCQNKNGLVKNKWQALTKMARSFLGEAKLQKN